LNYEWNLKTGPSIGSCFQGEENYFSEKVSNKQDLLRN